MKTLRFLATAFLLLPVVAQAQFYYAPAPTSGISRASFVQMVMSHIGSPQDGTDCFVDVQKQSYAPAICAAKQRGIVTGDPSARFRPDEAITFVEAAAVSIRAQGTAVPSDVVWYRPYLTVLSDWNAFPLSVSNVLYPISSSQGEELINNVFSADHSGSSSNGGSSSSSGSKSDSDADGDLHLTLKASDSSADTGDTVTYTITIRNDDNEDLENLEIRAYIASDFDFVSATDGGDYDNDRIDWDDIDVDEDESETIQFKLRVSGSADDGDKLNVRVRVEDAETELRLTVDEDSDNDDDDDNDGDLNITISDSPASPEPGDTVTYTIHLRNDDNEDMSVDVRAELDNDMEFVSASDSGDEDGDEVQWDNIRIDEDEEETLTLKVRIDEDTDDGDTVQLKVRAEGEQDTETTEIDEDSDDDDDDNDNDDDINITISDSPDPAEIGEIVMYTIRVENNSDENVEIDVTAEMDEGMSIYTSSDASERSGNKIYWRDLEIAENSVRTVNMKVRINVAAEDGEDQVLKVRAGTVHEEETTRIED
jgi:uncharacterized repeat protein (TIGR01451 family)